MRQIPYNEKIANTGALVQATLGFSNQTYRIIEPKIKDHIKVISNLSVEWPLWRIIYGGKFYERNP